MNKEILSLLPPKLLNVILNFKKDGYKWDGNYTTFEEALAKSTGYEANDIIEKTINRGVNSIHQSEISIVTEIQLIASIFICLNHIQKEKVNILDFGGATGGHYRLVKRFISNSVKMNYTVCETQALVKKAASIFSNDELSFIDDLEQYLVVEPDIVFSSGTLQCLSEPTSIYDKLLNMKPKFIVINRFPTINANKDRLTVQHVPKKIYEGSYPSWFFSKTKWEQIWQKTRNYETIIKWEPKNEYVFLDGKKVYYSGYVLRRLD